MKSFIYVLIIVALGLLVALRFYATAEPNLPKNRTLMFVGVVKLEPKIFSSSQVIRFADVAVYTSLYPSYAVGDKLQVAGFVESDGKMFRPKIELVGMRRGISSYFVNFKQKVSQNIAQVLPTREAELVQGTILGIDNIDQTFRDELIKTGTIHVVVVSGQNLMIVAGIFLSFVKYLGKRLCLVLAILAVFAYALLTGFEPPVVRAALMVLSSAIAIFFGRESSALRNLILAALVILIIWPRAIADISFELTFAASLGIIVLGQRLSKTWSRLPFIGETAGVAVSAYLFTAPIILFYFGRISPIAPLVNVLVIELVAPIMVGGFLLAIFGLIWLGFGQLIGFLVYLPATFFVRVVSAFAKLPFTQMNFGEGNFMMVILLYLLIFLVCLVFRSRNLSVEPEYHTPGV